MNFYDVNNMSELPNPPKGFRYFDFIGGEKEIRCFLCPENLSRGTFMKNHPELLGEALKPIYNHNGINVCQDTSCPLPAFYIVSPEVHYKSLDEMPPELHLRLMFVVQEVRKAMRELLNIEHAHVLYEEKNNEGCHVHFWILPIQNIAQNPRLYNFNIKSYMDTFKYSENKETIISHNRTLRHHFQETKLSQEDDALLKKLKG